MVHVLGLWSRAHQGQAANQRQLDKLEGALVRAACGYRSGPGPRPGPTPLRNQGRRLPPTEAFQNRSSLSLSATSGREKGESAINTAFKPSAGQHCVEGHNHLAKAPSFPKDRHRAPRRAGRGHAGAPPNLFGGVVRTASPPRRRARLELAPDPARLPMLEDAIEHARVRVQCDDLHVGGSTLNGPESASQPLNGSVDD